MNERSPRAIRLGTFLVAATMAATLLIGTRPADAATPAHADGIATAALGSARAVVWVTTGSTTGRLWYQRLTATGAPNGAPVLVDQGYDIDTEADYDTKTLGAAVSISLSPDGALVAVSGTLTGDQGVGERDTPFYTWVPNTGDPEPFGYFCGEPDGYPAPGTSAWTGAEFVVAITCPDGIDIGSPAGPSHIPGTDGAGPAAVAPLDGGYAVTWERVTSQGLDLAALIFTPDGNYTTLNPIPVTNQPGDQHQATIAANGSRWLIAWIDRATRRVDARTLGPLGGLGPIRHLVDATGNRNHPWLARSGGGWHLAWADLRTGTQDVWAAHVSSTVTATAGALVAGGQGPQSGPTVAPLPNGRGFVGYLDQGAGKARDLTASSAPTGSAQTVTVGAK